MENLISNDSTLITKSLKLLSDELKNPIKVVKALDSDILGILTFLLSDLGNYINHDIMQNSLQLLQLLSENLDASLAIATSKTLMEIVVNLTFDEELSMQSAGVMISLSSNPIGNFKTF